MKNSELLGLIKIAYNHVGTYGRDAARIYHAVVELDGQVRMWRLRAEKAEAANIVGCSSNPETENAE